MDEDERVSEFWIRRCAGWRGPSAALIVGYHTFQSTEKALSDLNTLDPYKWGT
jgi:hypothetical protein